MLLSNIWADCHQNISKHIIICVLQRRIKVWKTTTSINLSNPFMPSGHLYTVKSDKTRAAARLNQQNVHTAKLGIRPVWSESSLCAQWEGRTEGIFLWSTKTLISLETPRRVCLRWAHMTFCWFFMLLLTFYNTYNIGFRKTFNGLFYEFNPLPEDLISHLKSRFVTHPRVTRDK